MENDISELIRRRRKSRSRSRGKLRTSDITGEASGDCEKLED
jgi:hypothetical protein